MIEIFRFYFEALPVTAVLILLAIGIRFFLAKESSRLKCLVWLILMFRLLCPLSFETKYGFIPKQTSSFDQLQESFLQPEQETLSVQNLPAAPSMTENTDSIPPETSDSERSMQRVPSAGFLKVIMYVWYAGIIVFLIYTVWQILWLARLKKRSSCIDEEGRIYQWHNRTGACVIGLFDPKIYIPSDISEEEKTVIISHENMHIKRRDYLFILGYYTALILNWYNPLCWIAYFLVRQDIECACDEQTLTGASLNDRIHYAETLLRFYQSGNIKYPVLSFGNSGIKKRIINIGKQYPRKKWLTASILTVCISISLLGCLSYTKSEPEKSSYETLGEEMSQKQLGISLPEIIYADTGKAAFYDTYGLFIYDYAEHNFIGYVSFADIGMQMINGDNATFVYAGSDGNTYYITDAAFKNRYVYDCDKDLLTEGTFTESDLMPDKLAALTTEMDPNISAYGYIYKLPDGTALYFKYHDAASPAEEGLYKNISLNRYSYNDGTETEYFIYQ